MRIQAVLGTVLGLAAIPAVATDSAVAAEASFASGIYSARAVQASVEPSTKLARYWGLFGRSGNMCLTSLQVTHRGRFVRIAYKHVSDLCNIHRAEFVDASPYVELVLRGGDGSVGYEARFKMRGAVLAERLVRSGEFPQDYERTLLGPPHVVP